ncbi:beta-L-arabinofuranosidase domain-containing protein [Arthrobacter sp. AFG7.2]|uniref:beta-L-arabinofuranosidase domain-containing protein n=1 Tax=Arthrobacter sp. AFG7.2 TaxID=1688693 RepID=UPI00166FFEF6|nr:beta-L-arabinofuranosidase domain-containing protein [Arthrobacter sp. AFG7.2]
MHPTGVSLETAPPPSSFPLDRVRLLPGRFKSAQDVDIRYVLELDADRLCAPYLKEAGLATAAEPYGNWESDGMGGHINGHFLSACARLFAATEDVLLLERVQYVVQVLDRCQAAAGNGYVGGVPRGARLGEELAAGRIEADLFTLNGRWVPLYNLHKTFAGLLDAYTYAGSDNALAVLLRLADWWCDVSRRIDDDSLEEVLTTEFGGMNDVFTSLARVTGRKEYLREAERFSHRALLDPLAAGDDRLDGLHANTQIPKVVGYERYAQATGDFRCLNASDHFWDVVTRQRTVSIGGNSVREHFHPSRDFTPMVLDVQGPETCNTYNMLKLAKLRFERTGDPAALEFYERATFNHILSSQHPERGGFAYFTPMRPSHYRVYSTVHESMWCCVGSGMENHAGYGELVYSHSGDSLGINLYIPSTLGWTERGTHVHLDTDFPHSDLATLTVTAAAPTEFTLRLRRPAWATDMEVRASKTGEGLPAQPVEQENHVTIQRIWEGTTTVSIRLRAEVRAEALPDGSPWVSFLYGPVVLAAREGKAGLESFDAAGERMGHVASGPQIALANTPVVSAPDPADAVVLVNREQLAAELTATKEGSPVQVRLEPFAGIHDERYTVYWPTGAAPALRTAGLAAMDADAAEKESVIDAVTGGEQQPEADHFLTGEGTKAGGQDGLHWRAATGWFSYTLKDPATEAACLRVAVRQTPGRRQRLTLNGAPLTDALRTATDGSNVLTDYAIPAEARLKDPQTLVFAVHAEPGSSTEDLLSVELRKASRNG